MTREAGASSSLAETGLSRRRPIEDVWPTTSGRRRPDRNQSWPKPALAEDGRPKTPAETSLSENVLFRLLYTSLNFSKRICFSKRWDFLTFLCFVRCPSWLQRWPRDSCTQPRNSQNIPFSFFKGVFVFFVYFQFFFLLCFFSIA